MKDRLIEMQRISHDYIGVMTDGRTLAIDDDAIEALEHWSDDELGGFVRLRLMLMRINRLGGEADFGVDRAETITEVVPVNDDAGAGRETAE